MLRNRSFSQLPSLIFQRLAAVDGKFKRSPSVQSALARLLWVMVAELERIIRKARREKEQVQKPSLRDKNPVSVGRILKPIGTRDEWYNEMLEGRV